MFVEEFQTDYKRNWRFVEGDGPDGETIEVTDGKLLHESPRKYNDGGTLETRDTFEVAERITIEADIRSETESYWAWGFALRFEDGSGFTLKEHKWQQRNDLRLYIRPSVDRDRNELDLTEATSSTDWHRYRLEIDFEAENVVELSRDDERFTLNEPFGEYIPDPGEFRLRIGVDRGHKVWYDRISLTSDGTDEPPEPTPSTPVTATPTTTPKELPYDLEGAAHATSVTVDGDERYILWAIPGADPDRPAVTTPDYELVSPDLALDALIVDVWNGQDKGGWTDAIKQAESHREQWLILEQLSRVANVSADVAAALALAQVSPTAALSSKLDALDSAIAWQQDAIEDPYREQFSKMAEAAATVEWSHGEFTGITSVTELSQDAIEVIEFAVEAYEAVDLLTDIESVARTVIEVAERTDSVTNGLVAGGQIAEATAFQMFPTIAASYAVEEWTGLFEANARTAAAGVAYNTVRLPILRELDDLHRSIDNGTADPAKIVQYHVEMMVQYQIGAVATSLMAEYQDGVSRSLLGSVLSEVFGSEEIADRGREVSDRYTALARHSIAELGAGWSLARSRLTDSINAELIKEVEP